MQIADYQRRFIDFLVHSGALLFGDFVTKSGRNTPYFINTGKFDDGQKISELGSYYAAHIMNVIKPLPEIIFGPAYKGVPLAVSTAIALHTNHDQRVFFTFDRKEAKDHGDKGTVVGRQIDPGQRVVIVEDVITAGTTLRSVVPMLKEQMKAQVAGVVIAVDRAERGTADKSAVEEAQQELGVSIFPLVNVHQLIAYLSQANSSGTTLDGSLVDRMHQYLRQYGV